jgi:AcrR family transcriptional regulator
MSPKPDVSDERKTQILDAAMDTFAQKGFHKTRMSDIAETSGLSKGSLYWYFDSKDAIILNLLDKVFEPELKEFKALITDRRPVLDRLYHYADRAGEDIIKMLNWMPLFYEFIALAFRREIIRKSITRYYQINVDLLESLIQEGIDSGELKAENALDVAIAISAIIEGTVVLWFYDPDNISIQDHIRSNIRLLLKGIKKD